MTDPSAHASFHDSEKPGDTWFRRGGFRSPGDGGMHLKSVGAAPGFIGPE